MLKKELRLVVTFKNTVDAMRMEEKAKEAGISGRLIPIPPQITAGCGLAFMAPIKAGADLELLMRTHGITCEQKAELLL
ncbi:MAG: DUF3343 domain-containing protein [Lachnospiraceae bacterium]